MASPELSCWEKCCMAATWDTARHGMGHKAGSPASRRLTAPKLPPADAHLTAPRRRGASPPGPGRGSAASLPRCWPARSSGVAVHGQEGSVAWGACGWSALHDVGVGEHPPCNTIPCGGPGPPLTPPPQPIQPRAATHPPPTFCSAPEPSVMVTVANAISRASTGRPPSSGCSRWWRWCDVVC